MPLSAGGSRSQRVYRVVLLRFYRVRPGFTEGFFYKGSTRGSARTQARETVIVSTFKIIQNLSLRVQVPNYHILSKIVTYITTILNPST